MKEKIKIVEVGPRDGLQNEQAVWSVDDRVELIEQLIKIGVDQCEAGSFVSEKAVPAMACSAKVFEKLQDHADQLSFLVPNIKGLEAASNSGVKKIAVFTATSDSFNRKNINKDVKESLIVLSEVCQEALKKKMEIRGYVSTAFGCPYEGGQSVKRVIEVTNELFKMGCYEVSIGDTIGVAHPVQIKEVFKELSTNFEISKLAAHFHDTRGMALVNICEALEIGVRVVDSSIGGLGGCPYAPGASGNVATEEVNHLLLSLGFETGIDTFDLLKLIPWIEKHLGRQLKSKLHVSAPKILYYDR